MICNNNLSNDLPRIRQELEDLCVAQQRLIKDFEQRMNEIKQIIQEVG